MLACQSVGYGSWNDLEPDNSDRLLGDCDIERVPGELHRSCRAAILVRAQFLPVSRLMHGDNYVEMVEDVHGLALRVV